MLGNGNYGNTLSTIKGIGIDWGKVQLLNGGLRGPFWEIDWHWGRNLKAVIEGAIQIEGIVSAKLRAGPVIPCVGVAANAQGAVGMGRGILVRRRGQKEKSCLVRSLWTWWALCEVQSFVRTWHLHTENIGAGSYTWSGTLLGTLRSVFIIRAQRFYSFSHECTMQCS